MDQSKLVIRAETDYDLLQHLGITLIPILYRDKILSSLFAGESVVVTKARMVGLTELAAYYCACVIEYSNEKPLIIGGTYSMQRHFEYRITDLLKTNSWLKLPMSNVMVIDEAASLSISSFNRKMQDVRGLRFDQAFIYSTQNTINPTDSVFNYVLNRPHNCYLGVYNFSFKHIVATTASVLNQRYNIR